MSECDQEAEQEAMYAGLFDPASPSPPLTAERVAARRRMTYADRWAVTTMERRLGRTMTEEEERVRLELPAIRTGLDDLGIDDAEANRATRTRIDEPRPSS